MQEKEFIIGIFEKRVEKFRHSGCSVSLVMPSCKPRYTGILSANILYSVMSTLFSYLVSIVLKVITYNSDDSCTYEITSVIMFLSAAVMEITETEVETSVKILSIVELQSLEH